MSEFDIFGGSTTERTVKETGGYTLPAFSLPLHQADSEHVRDGDQAGNSLGGFSILTTLTLLVAGLLIVQCFNLQLYQGSRNRALAEGNSVRLVSIPADRGLIVDSNNAVLAQNTQQLALSVKPQNLPVKKADRQAIYTIFKEKAGISEETIALIELSRSKGPDPLILKQNLTKEESLLYREWFSDTLGVDVEEAPIRTYAAIPSLGHILGYVGGATAEDVEAGAKATDILGRSGIEASYNDQLHGEPGVQKAIVNASGDVQSGSAPANPAPQAGATLRLSIDSSLQKVVATALQHAIERRTKKFGELPTLGASAVAIDPRTGAIKAMVSLPDYDANLFAKGISQKDYASLLANPANPLLDRAIAGQFPSGSVIKPMLAAAGLQEGIITADTTVTTPEAIYVGQYRFPDWKLHGLTNTRKAIAESNNIFFYAIGGGWKEQNINGLGPARIKSYLELFGVGTKLGFDVPGESKGLVPDEAWKEENIGEPWYIGDTYQTSIGQGKLLTTPLQMAVATAAIQNGGTVWEPHVVMSTINPSTGAETQGAPTALRSNIISPQNLQVVWEGMLQTTDTGSAHPLKSLKVRSAGKTGTAEFGDKGLTHAWYVGGVRKADNPSLGDIPELTFAILVEGGGDSYYSSVPVAEEILRGYYNDPLAPGQALTSEPTGANASSEFAGER